MKDTIEVAFWLSIGVIIAGFNSPVLLLIGLLSGIWGMVLGVFLNSKLK